MGLYARVKRSVRALFGGLVEKTEDPEKILSDIEVGIEAGLKEVHKPYLKIVDRRAAIRRAIAEARSGDIVIIAGKGHEDYQIIGDDVLPFDDRAVAREALSELN